jgi:transmembrane sensor
MITKISPRGVKMKIMLPDGTVVNLNSESTIRYPATFNKKERQVHFFGEAFFNVYPDSSRPFKIYSENFETEVLGTSFNIRAYPEELTSKVAVANGLVKVINQHGEHMLLSEHEMAVLNVQDATIKLTSFILQEEIGWKDGILHFDNVPLKNVFDELEKWFGVDIHCDSGERLNDIYNGKFTNESLKNILEGIGYTSRFNFTINGNDVYISTRKEVQLN